MALWIVEVVFVEGGPEVGFGFGFFLRFFARFGFFARCGFFLRLFACFGAFARCGFGAGFCFGGAEFGFCAGFGSDGGFFACFGVEFLRESFDGVGESARASVFDAVSFGFASCGFVELEGFFAQGCGESLAQAGAVDASCSGGPAYGAQAWQRHGVDGVGEDFFAMCLVVVGAQGPWVCLVGFDALESFFEVAVEADFAHEESFLLAGVAAFAAIEDEARVESHGEAKEGLCGVGLDLMSLCFGEVFLEFVVGEHDAAVDFFADFPGAFVFAVEGHQVAVCFDDVVGLLVVALGGFDEAFEAFDADQPFFLLFGCHGVFVEFGGWLCGVGGVGGDEGAQGDPAQERGEGFGWDKVWHVVSLSGLGICLHGLSFRGS